MKVMLKTFFGVLLCGLFLLNCGSNGGGSESTESTESSGEALSINFISSDPKTISLASTAGAGRVETSKLVFQVIDEFGVPLEGEQVDFELSTTVSEISLLLKMA